MPIFSRIKNLCQDFLFPKSRRVIELENLSPETLLKTLPPPPERPRDKKVFAVFDYNHPVVKEMIWELKYAGNRTIADKFGEILYDTLIHELEDLAVFEKWEKPILMPIPVSGKRRFARGWNQAELLAEKIKARDKEGALKYVSGQLVKVRHTESQTQTASRGERLENLKNSMEIKNPKSVAERCIVVIDDVVTTGATFREAVRALKDAGAKKILCLAVAH